jgi:hypothetical protein
MSPEVAAVVVSSVSLLLAGMSLFWQVAEWRLSGGRPKAALLQALVLGSHCYVHEVRASGKPAEFSTLYSQGIAGTPALGIRLVNHGRASVTVVRIEVHTRRRSLALVPTAELLGPALPHRLDPGMSSEWFTAMANAEALVSTARAVTQERVSGVYMAAELATGRTVATSTALRL